MNCAARLGRILSGVKLPGRDELNTCFREALLFVGKIDHEFEFNLLRQPVSCFSFLDQSKEIDLAGGCGTCAPHIFGKLQLPPQ